MKLNNIISEFKLDKRMVNWSLDQKLLTHKEYEQHLKALPDLSSEAEELSVQSKEDKEEVTE